MFTSERGEIMKYGYARVSTRGQDLQAQINILEQEDCQEVHKEKFTGTQRDRPKFNKLLEVLQKGDTLTVTKLDRLARNTREGIEVVEYLFDRGVRVHVLNVGLLEDTTMGRFFLQTMLAVAEMERNMIVERTQEGKAIAKQQPDFREGRPKKYNRRHINHALKLLKNNSYKQVEEMTGISKSTLIRAKNKEKGKEQHQ